jgi:hypothetical protein
MLRFITDLASPLLEFVKDDPVRPEIPVEDRVGTNKFISSIVEDEKPKAIVCVSLHDFVPTTVAELAMEALEPNTAIFYTIWSYVPGEGQKLIRETVESIREQFPNITRFVTLSPKTATAKRFHIKNGAFVLRENEETINYEYSVIEQK